MFILDRMVKEGFPEGVELNGGQEDGRGTATGHVWSRNKSVPGKGAKSLRSLGTLMGLGAQSRVGERRAVEKGPRGHGARWVTGL